MKKKGFTLIELLAVIVILALISLITVSKIVGIVEEAKISAAKSSTTNYIDMVNNLSTQKFIDVEKGLNSLEEIDGYLTYSGEKPSEAIIKINSKHMVEEAKICVNEISLYYDGKKVNETIDDYCSGSLENPTLNIIIGGTTVTEEIGLVETYTYDISSYNISSYSNIVCDNGSKAIINGTDLVISNLSGDATCMFNETLDTTMSNINSYSTSIYMLSNFTTTTTYTIPVDRIVNLELNGKVVTGTIADLSPFVYNSGNFIVNDSLTGGTITSNTVVIRNSGETTINSGNIISTDITNKSTIYGEENSNTYIYGGYIEGPYGIGGMKNESVVYMYDGEINATIYNGINFNSGYNSKGYIYNGKITGYNYAISYSGTEEINIYSGIFINNIGISTIVINSGDMNMLLDDNSKIYIKSNRTSSWGPAFSTYSSGTVVVKGIQADNCTGNPNDTTYGICIYAIGDGLFTGNTSNGAIRNVGTGTLKIDGATLVGGWQSINNGSTGNLYVKNSRIISYGLYGVLNNTTGNAYICSSSFVVTGNRELTNMTTGTINYSSDNIFNSGNNTPLTYGSYIYSGYTCS